MCDRVWCELGAERREVLQQQRRQETILSERQQVLLVQGIDVRLCVLLDDTVRDDDRSALVGGTNAVHGETSGKTRHRAEQTLEGLRQVVGDVVLVNLGRRQKPRMTVCEIYELGSLSTMNLPRFQASSHRKYR